MDCRIGYSDNDKQLRLALIDITEHSSISDYSYEKKKTRKIDNYIDELVHKQDLLAKTIR